MSGKIITISRQFGSGGRTIGKKLAAELGIPCYDSEIIAEIAKKSGFDQDYVRENSEYTSETGLFAALSGVDFYGHSNRDEIWITQCRVIRELAEEGPCVIIGRCADYVLKEDHDLLKVFIYSDMESRAQRIVEQYGESNVNPEKRLKDKDKRRAARNSVISIITICASTAAPSALTSAWTSSDRSIRNKTLHGSFSLPG